MKRSYVLGFLVLVMFDTFTQISFKYAAMATLPLELNVAWFVRLFSEPWVYGAVFGYLCAFITWMTVLKHMAVGPSFAASHLEIVSVTILSIYLFNEPLNAYKVTGGLLILVGVLCLAKSEGEEERAHETRADDALYERI